MLPDDSIRTISDALDTIIKKSNIFPHKIWCFILGRLISEAPAITGVSGIFSYLYYEIRSPKVQSVSIVASFNYEINLRINSIASV